MAYHEIPTSCYDMLARGMQGEGHHRLFALVVDRTEQQSGGKLGVVANEKGCMHRMARGRKREEKGDVWA